MSRTSQVVVGAVALLLILTVGASWVVPFGWGPGHCSGIWTGWTPGGYNVPLAVVSVVGTLLFWALVVAAGVWFFRALARPMGIFAAAAPEGAAALDALRRRYASGELSKEQFDEMKSHLSL